MQLLIILTILLTSLNQINGNEESFNPSAKNKEFRRASEDKESVENKEDIAKDASKFTSVEILDESDFSNSNLKYLSPIKGELAINDKRNFNNHYDTDRSSEEMLAEEENTLKLRYAALEDEEGRKNTDISTSDIESSSSENSENNPSPQIFSNPKFKQIFRQDPEKNIQNFEDNISVRTFYPRISYQPRYNRRNGNSQMRPNLGGYDSSVETDESSSNPSSNSEEKLAPKSKNEKKDIYNRDNEGRQYQKQMIRQVVKHTPYQMNLPSMPQIKYDYPSSRDFYSQSQLPRNQLQGPQVVDNSVSENIKWLEQLRNAEIRTYPPILMPNYNHNFDIGQPISRNDFSVLPSPEPYHAFGVTVPQSQQRVSSIPITVHQRNSYPVFSDFERPISVANQIYSRYPDESVYNQRDVGLSALHPRDIIRPVSPLSSSLRNHYSDPLFNPFIYESNHAIGRSHLIPLVNPQTVVDRKDVLKESDNKDQMSEPANQIQDAESKQNNENLYLNYPTTKAGYGTQEQLPAQNGSSNLLKETENKEKEKLPQNIDVLFKTFSNDFAPREFPIERPMFSFSAGNPFIRKIENSSNLPESETSSENKTKLFNPSTFYRNFPPPPPQFNRPQFVPIDHAMFFRSPVSAPINVGAPVFPNDPFYTAGNPNSNDTFYANRPGPVVQQYPYGFLNSYIRTNINEDETPKCAANSSSTICFEDAEYPKNEILRSLDTEAFVLLRVLPPSSNEESSTALIDEKSSNEDENANICTSDITKGHPLRAMNARGKWKIIINLGDVAGRFKQNIAMENCRNLEKSCSYTDQSISSRCVQKYSSHRLFVWNRDRGLHSDIFKLPVSCSCQIVKK